MKKIIFFILFLYISSFCSAQIYKYIGVEDGLSSRRVYAIQKGPRGHMWFLTQNGIDRYDGKEFRLYQLFDGETINPMLNYNWLCLDTDSTLWQIGWRGKIFRYDFKHDQFELIYKIPDEITKKSLVPVSYGYINNNNVAWLCGTDSIYLYNINTKKTTVVKNEVGGNITDIEQIDAQNYFIGTDNGIRYVELADNALKITPNEQLDHLELQVNELLLHKASRKLFIGTFQKGMYLYDMNIKKTINLETSLVDITINRIKPFNDKEILIATDGAGIHKMDVGSYKCEPYIVANYNSYNGMNGNSINDIYIDGDRIWMANNPLGITVRNNQYTSYKWIKHSIGNKQSLVNDRVNTIIEDSEGDIWFATNNGISLYISKTNKWHSFLSMDDPDNKTKNQIFISLCEVAPGVIWAGGYSSGIYQINKKDLSISFFTPSSSDESGIRPDKYIRAITKDSDGTIWSGGYYNLKQIDYNDRTAHLAHGLSGVTEIIEKDKKYMWIGTVTGLFLLEKETGQAKYISLPTFTFYINSLYQDKNGLLYIGTSNSGLLTYDHEKKEFEHYHKNNSALVSDNIYTILSNNNKNIVLGTENGISNFDTEKKVFQNWTKDQGLMTDHFNPKSGALLTNGNFILGSTDGAVEYDKDMTIPQNLEFEMIFRDLRVFYQTVYPGDEGSPLEVDIDETQTLKLKHNQNTLSLRVSSINYDYPSLLMYSWKLDGFYESWSRPERDCQIRLSNLRPGKYTLHVCAISSEDQRITLDERTMEIIIDEPFWLSIWAWLFYIAILASIAVISLRMIILRKQRNISDEKIRFFINTAHDIRTPLTLIKAPLEELSEKEALTPDGRTNMKTAIRNVNALLRLTTNLINFERVDTYSSSLYVSEYELSTYMEEMINAFQPYADVKHINLTYESNFRYMNVWFDKDKMDSILKNVITNALKYTPEGGSVHISVTETENIWNIEVKDTGIGVPASEQKKLFKIHFRGSNAINSKVTGSGIGLLLVGKLVHLHKGRINFTSTEGEGSCIKMTFPKGKKDFNKAIHSPRIGSEKIAYKESGVPEAMPADMVYESAKQTSSDLNRSKILIVEDNDELREYLRNTLSDTYAIRVCSDGKQALEIVKEYMPNMIISDIMMPEMRGDEMCHILKNDIDTSHIPIILLTALNNDRNIIEGLKTGADEYIVKPFNIGILRATIANILANRSLLRRKYASLEINEEEDDIICINCSTDIDRKFMSSVKKNVEDNIDNPVFNVDQLCAIMNMSRTSFYNKIKALTDQAPGDYIRLIRLKRAAQLLKEHQHSVTEVAEMTGFSDAKYFREVFKKHFNASPSQYAKQEDEDDNAVANK